MKKKTILSLMLAILSVFILTSCAKRPSYSGAFSQDEFLLSQNESVTLADSFEAKGIDLSSVSFTLSNDNAEIIDGQIIAKKSGKVIVKAVANGKVFASANVAVKAKFAQISSVNVDANGRLSWKECYQTFEGQVYKAQYYDVTINGNKYTTSNNSYDLYEKGVYTVQVSASALKYVDASVNSRVFEINYGLMPQVEQITIENPEKQGDQNSTIRWANIESAKYNVYANGILIKSKINENFFSFNFANFHPSESIRFKIETIDAQNNLLPSSKEFYVQKLLTPALAYESGNLQWDDLISTSKFRLYYQSEADPQINGYLDEKDFAKNGDYSCSLPGLSKGIYKVSVFAVGGENGEILFANSNLSTLQYIAKLEVPRFDHEISGNNLEITFDSDDYVKNYNVIIKSASKEREYVIEIANNVLSIDISEFETGSLSVSVQAKYNSNASGIEEITIGSIKSTSIIPSDKKNFTIFKLDEISAVNHQLVDGNSILTFGAVENAENYRVFLNEALLPDAGFTVENGRVIMTIDNLANYAPASNAYNFKIEAYRLKNDSTVSSTTKTIQILVNVTKSPSQTNGYFTWNATNNESAQIAYEVYSTDSSYSAKDNLIQSGIALTNRNNDKLELGYYIIDVYTKSLDTNLYLDSNFYDNAAIFSDNFLVYKNLDEPVLNFIASQGKLEIQTVANAGEYEIYLNGTYLSSIFSKQENTTLTFTQLGTGFGEAGDYNIDVKAKVSEDEDASLYKDSELSRIVVTRLEKPTFTLDENENLTVTMPTGADHVVIKKGDVVLNSDKHNVVSISDIEGATQLRLAYKAIDKIDKHFYLDSDTLSANFNRLARPTAVRYDNGKILYECADDDKTSEYRIAITFVTNNADKTYNVTCDIPSFNLQTYIDEQCKIDNQFKAFYLQATEIDVKVIAFTLGQIDNVYYLPSHFGYTNLGDDTLKITPLKPTVVSFDTASKTISWAKAGTIGTTFYSIYLNGQLLAGDITAQIYDLTSLDFTTEKTITVIAKNSNYLTSSSSNEVIIKEIKPISSLTVLKEGFLNGNVAQANIGEVKKLSINNALTDIGSNFSINLALYAPNYNLNLYFVGQDMKSTTRTENGIVIAENRYYIDSTSVNYNFVDLSQETSSVTLEELKLSWTGLAQNWIGAANQLSYDVLINDKAFGLVNVTENFLLLSNETLFNLEAGEYTLKVVSALPVSYVLIPQNANAFGYFGEKILGETQLVKLDKIGGETISIIDALNGDLLNQKLNAYVQVSWNNIWTDGANTYFKIKIPSLIINDKAFEITIKAGDKSTLLGYELKLDQAENKFIFTVANRLNSVLYKGLIFPVGKCEIEVQTMFAQSVSSDYKTIEFSRLQDFTSAEIDDQGMLKLANEESNLSYIISLTMAGETQYIQSNENTIDLLSAYIGNKVGAYTINVIAYGGAYIPQQSIFELAGYRLKGLQNATVTASGEIELALHVETEGYEDVEFVVKHQGVIKSFAPTLSESVYKISTSELLAMFDILESKDKMMFEFGVRRAGSINSSFVATTFSFVTDSENLTLEKRRPTYEKSIYAIDEDGNYGLIKTNETDLTQDYIIILGEVENTTGLVVAIKYIDDIFVEQTKTLAIDINSIKGYWITVGGKQYFSKTESLEAGAINELCFAIDATAALSEFGFNTYNFEIYRIGVIDGVVTNFGKQTASYLKLQSLKLKDSFAVNENVISWKGIDSSKINGYFINLYNQSGDLYRKAYVENGTSYDISKLIDDAKLVLNLSISTVSLSVDNIASNETVFVYNDLNKYIQIEKYVAPSKLVVTNGNLHFENFTGATSELLKDIETLYQQNNAILVQYIMDKTYTLPFTFKSNTIAETRVKLMFVGERTYFATVRAIDLIAGDFNKFFRPIGASSDVSYKQAIESLKTTYGGTVTGAGVKSLYEALVSSTMGLSNNNMLFDDNGDEIPSGLYDVKLMQNGRAIDKFSSYVALPSNYCDPAQVSVTQSPILKLEVSKDESLNNVYSLGFSPVKLLTTASENAQAYVLNFRKDGAFKFAFDITYSGKWQIKIDEQTFDVTEKNGYLCLVFDSSLRSALRNKIDGDEYDVSIYAQGNDYSLNSKTQTIKFALLEFNHASLELNDGQFNWQFEAGNKNGTMINYKLSTNSTVSSMVVTDPRLNLPSPGLYDYVSFMAYGGISPSSMYVDSPAYKLEHLYKRSTPLVSVNKGIFSVKMNDSNHYKNNVFIVENNESIANNIQGLKFETTSYRAGGAGEAYKATESGGIYNGSTYGKAKAYLFKSVGTTCKDFIATDNILTPSNGVDFEINGERVLLSILTSNSRSINAQLLGQTDEVKVKDGIFEWKAQEKELDDNAQLGYRITINAYADTQVAGKKAKEGSNVEPQASSVYFATTNSFDSSIIEFSSLNKDNSYLYDFTISTVSLKEVGEGEPFDVTAVNGKKYALVGATFTEGDTKYFGLISDDFTFMPKALKKLKAVTGAVVSDEALVWYYDFDGQKLDKSKVGFKVFSGSAEVEGTFGNPGENSISFTPKSLTYGAPFNLTVYAYINGEQTAGIMLDSDKVTVEEIYKLKDIEDEHVNLTARFDNQNEFVGYKLSFEKYFKFYSQDTSILNIKIYVNGAVFEDFKFSETAQFINVLSGSAVIYDTGTKNLTLPLDANISLKAVGAEGINKKILSTSRTDSFTLLSSDFIIGDGSYGDSISWDNQNLNFKWTDEIYQVNSAGGNAQVYMFENVNGKLQAKPISKDAIASGETIVPVASQTVDGVKYLQLEKDSNRYIKESDIRKINKSEGREYLIILTYDNKVWVEELNEWVNFVETATVLGSDSSELRYSPKNMGAIIKAEVYKRDGLQSFYSQNKLTYSQKTPLDMFAGGDGSENNPYLIASPEQFKNISQRNDKQYFFALTSDITIDLSSYIVQDFKGVLNGNGHTILLNLRGVNNSSLNITLPNDFMSSITYTNAAALFNSIANGAKIWNINVSLNMGGLNLTEPSVITSLATINYGTIENVEIKNITSDFTNANRTMLSGLTTQNYGRLQSCKNSANLTLTNDNLVYGGLVITNLNTNSAYVGLIQDSLNTGNVKIQTRSNNANVWVAGIAVNMLSSAKILRCGNDGNITVTRSGSASAMVSMAGIVIDIKGTSTIQYCYNNKEVSTNAGTSYVAGVAYSIVNSTVGALADTFGQKVAYSCASVTNKGACYALSGYTTEGLNNAAMSDVELSAGSNKIFKITSRDEGGVTLYSASII